jgi:hypothetical protein
VAYDANGQHLWDSGTLLDGSANLSAPMVGQDNSVIAVDDVHVFRFSGTGQVSWMTATPGGYAISPVLTQSGAIVMATRGGLVSAYDSGGGAFIGQVALPDDSDGRVYGTLNTPCVLGNRIYVAANKRNDVLDAAKLVAIDLNVGDVTHPLSIAWTFPFMGPTGGSPLCIQTTNTVFFDGRGRTPGDPSSAFMFAVRDRGQSGALVWARQIPGVVVASPAQDPRGGVWIYCGLWPFVMRLGEGTGATVQQFDLRALVNDGTRQFGTSAVTIAGTAAAPVMILGTGAQHAASYVLAIDLSTSGLIWKVGIAADAATDVVHAQFPIVLDASGQPVVVAPGGASGARGIGLPKVRLIH